FANRVRCHRRKSHAETRRSVEKNLDAGRGRDSGCPLPPAQSRAGATHAHGSCLGCLASKRSVGWSRAVNRTFPSFFATSRTRSSPLDPLSRLCVRHWLDCSVFSLTSGLPSTTSACGLPLLFGCFVG